MTSPDNQAPQESSQSAQKKIAIVAVHGISDQKPYNTAREVADILNMMAHDPDQLYGSIPIASEEHTLRIPVHMAKPGEADRVKAAARAKSKVWKNNGGRSGRSLIDVHLAEHPYQAYTINEDKLLAKLESNFLNDQLINYAPHPDAQQECDHYRTIRVDQSLQYSLPSGEKPKLTAHVYEMYWGDLSRLGNSIWSLLNEFNQLLFHVASLGQHVVTLGFLEASSRYPRKSKAWKNWQSYIRFQEIAVALISLWIPLFNLQLLLLLGLTLIGKIPVIQNWLPSSDCRLLLPFSIYLLSYGLISWGLGQSVIRAYEKRRPGALIIYALSGIVTGVVISWQLLSLLIHPDSSNGLQDLIFRPIPNSYDVVSYISFRTIEVLYGCLVLIWTVFYGVQACCWNLGRKAKLYAVQEVKQVAGTPCEIGLKNWQIRIDRCNTTAQLTLAVSTALYFMIMAGLWFGVYKLESWFNLLPQGNWYQFSEGFRSFYNVTPAPLSTLQWMYTLVAENISLTYGLNLILLLVSVGLLVWGVQPSISKERKIPLDDTKSTQGGDRLDQGFWTMQKISGNLLLVNMIVLSPLGYILGYAYKFAVQNYGFRALNGFKDFNLGISMFLLTAIPLLVLVILVSKSIRFNLRGILDAILDVDNYIRVHPLENNPRSRIFARYISLLRHLAIQKYDGIVIVAHSQGGVISADVLRFLQREASHDLAKRDPALAPLLKDTQQIPIRFFTMGVPIHQLYSHAFPHLYHWAAHYDEHPSQDRTCDRPRPAELGIEQWVNTYGSGDYVGRYFWGRNHDMYKADENIDSGHPNAYEFCLGDLAHTHYWDGSRKQVAQTLHQMVSTIVLTDNKD